MKDEGRRVKGSSQREGEWDPEGGRVGTLLGSVTGEW